MQVDRRLPGERRSAKQVKTARTAWLKAGDITKTQLMEIYGRERGRCHYCGERVPAIFRATNPVGFDHVVSRQDGGLHTASNLAVCCVLCNRAKG